MGLGGLKNFDILPNAIGTADGAQVGWPRLAGICLPGWLSCRKKAALVACRLQPIA